MNKVILSERDLLNRMNADDLLIGLGTRIANLVKASRYGNNWDIGAFFKSGNALPPRHEIELALHEKFKNYDVEWL